jgi:hypothetical protein
VAYEPLINLMFGKFESSRFELGELRLRVSTDT